MVLICLVNSLVNLRFFEVEQDFVSLGIGEWLMLHIDL